MAEKVGIGTAGAAIGLLHDLGKYSRDFQQYLRRMAPDQDTEQQGPGRGKIDHSTAGAQTIWRSLKCKGNLEGVVGEILSLCLASHHSGLIDCIAPDGDDKLSRRMRKADPDSHYGEAWANAEQPVIERNEEHLHNPDLSRGVRDFVARLCRTDRNETIRRFEVGLLVRFLFSCLIDADRTDTADFSRRDAASLRQYGRYVEWPMLAGLLERELERFSGHTKIDQLRKRVSASCLSASVRPRGIFGLTVPTGGGKTLASFAASPGI
jgi:CRISPR-associated endonuclease/helicase Cas3